jgi:hypothetical protein
MKAPRKLLRVLNVHRDEWWLVRKLFMMQFFQGAGITFFFTAAFSRFLELFAVSELAYVFILSSFLLWVTGFIYSKLEHHLSPYRLSMVVTAILAGSMILFRVGEGFISADWFYFVMLAWFNVMYLLNNLMFWGMASQLYDVRQSKRLFSVISAGDIPAKFIGYSLALVAVSYIGTANLLIPGLVFILLSFQYIKKILPPTHEEKKHHHTPSPTHITNLNSIVKNFWVNTLVRRVALLSLIVSACIILINYGFYSEVKQQNKDDVALATFITLFLASARLIALLIKVIITSRLLYWLGNRSALLITPVLLILLIASLQVTGALSSSTKLVLYIFGLAAIITEVLNSAINAPILLTMMQPLSTLERLRAHNIVKGIMDPFAYLLSGIFILVIVKMKIFDLKILSYVLLGLTIAWIIGIFKVHQEYLKALIKTISSRYFTQDEFNLFDPATKGIIEKKLKNGVELEVMYILRMLSSRRSEESNRLIMLALEHPSSKIVEEALHIIGELHIREAEPRLLSLVEKSDSHSIRSTAVKISSKIAYDDTAISALMESNEEVVRNSAIVSVLNHSRNEAHRQEAERKIRNMLNSESGVERLQAVTMLCETSHGAFDNELIRLLDEKDAEIRQKVIRAIGHHPSEACLERMLHKTDVDKHIIEAFVISGEAALPYIKKRLFEKDCTARQKEMLINVTGRINGKEGDLMLIQLLTVMPEFRTQIIRVLHRHRYKADKESQPVIESFIHIYLSSAAAILHMQKKIQPDNQRYKILFGSLQLELSNTRETLLYLFSFLFDRDKINKIKMAIEINKKETNANAIELVDMTVKKEFANPFNAAFEHGDLEHRCELLKYLFPKNTYHGIDSILSELLVDKKFSYNNWTKASALYTTKKYGPQVGDQFVNKYLDAESILVKETAAYAANNP